MKTISRYIMTLALLLTAVGGAWAQTQWNSGECTVTLNNGTLTVSGNGAMDEYADPSDRPWHDNMGDITSVVVESGVTSVGMAAFFYCTAMTSVTLPEGLTAIGANAFFSCSSLTSVTIPSTVTAIGTGAFRGCSAMTSVTLPEGLTTIGGTAFASCSSLTSITIPSTVTSIGQGAFGSCSAISDVNLYANPDNLTWSIDTHFASDDFKSDKATQCHVLAEHLSTYQNNFSIANVTFVGDLQPLATSDVEVTPGSSANTWTFAMPGSDVVLTPIYAKAAAFATTGTEPEVKTLLPEAAEGVIAGTDASLIAEGTGIVAFAGTSTEVKQGTVMYAVTPASVTDASELISSDWKNTVPTAKNIADKGAEVKVWYYIQGADTPDGETPTADNTFNDSEICTTPLTVTVRSNKFDITLKAANDNTIEAGKATVTVGGTAATVTEGKLEGVKMGSEVKLEAKPGYKFRKVEVKKGASTPTLKDALKDGATVVITYVWDGETTFTYTNNGGNYTGNTTGDEAAYFANGMSKDGTTLKFTASNMDLPQANVSIDFFTDSNEYYFNSKGDAFDSFTISVNGTDVTSQLTAVK